MKVVYAQTVRPGPRAGRSGARVPSAPCGACCPPSLVVLALGGTAAAAHASWRSGVSPARRYADSRAGTIAFAIRTRDGVTGARHGSRVPVGERGQGDAARRLPAPPRRPPAHPRRPAPARADGALVVERRRHGRAQPAGPGSAAAVRAPRADDPLLRGRELGRVADHRARPDPLLPADRPADAEAPPRVRHGAAGARRAQAAVGRSAPPRRPGGRRSSRAAGAQGAAWWITRSRSSPAATSASRSPC